MDLTSALWALFTSYIVPILGTLIAVGIGWILLILRQKFNLNIDDSLRDSLQTALDNAANLLIQKAGDSIKSKVSLSVSDPLVAAAVNYVLKAAPDALARFGLSPTDIVTKLEAKLGAK